MYSSSTKTICIILKSACMFTILYESVYVYSFRQTCIFSYLSILSAIFGIRMNHDIHCIESEEDLCL